MDITIENILLIGSILLFISLIAGKTSYKFGVPTLILFLLIGMLAGSEGIGGINFDDPGLAQFIGIVALNFILFSGGLDTDWKSVKPILGQGIVLSTAGVLITALCLGFFVHLITDFSLFEGMLLGAIVSSTDAAAVFSILRSKNLDLKYQLKPTLELESGSNDPMAYVLTIAFISLILDPGASWGSVVSMFIIQMSTGAILGYFFGILSKFVINRIRLDFEGLYPVLMIALMFITFSATDFLGGNGFLAIYICAVYLGGQDLIHKGTIVKMFDGLAWLMQIILFLTLGLLVFPSQIWPLVGLGLLISGFLIIIARPLSVFLCLLAFRMHLKRRVYLSWAGLRGAVPIVFATYPLIEGLDKANIIFNLVFFVAVSSVLIQGTTLSLFARWLKLDLPQEGQQKAEPDLQVSKSSLAVLEEMQIDEDSKAAGKMIVELNFPKTAIIAMIKRGETFITPQGSTVIESGDLLFVLSNSKEHMEDVKQCLFGSQLT